MMNFFLYSILVIFIISSSEFVIKNSIPKMGDIFKDIPNDRSSHSIPKLKSGGIFFISFVLFFNIIAIFQNGSNELSEVIFLSSLMGFIGLIDDLISLSSILRYFLQLIISFLIVHSTQSNLLSSENFYNIIPLALIGPAIINLINFMDGIDGLLIGCTLPLLIYSQLKIVDVQIIVLICSMVTFLKWNWHPSKLFMGDCGSNFLGSLVFYFLISDNNFIDLNALVIIFPLLFDSSFCILKRIAKKENIFLPHKKHIYQRLHQAGLSHGKVSLIYIFFCLINLIITTNYGIKISIFTIVLESLILIYLDKFIAKKFS